MNVAPRRQTAERPQTSSSQPNERASSFVRSSLFISCNEFFANVGSTATITLSAYDDMPLIEGRSFDMRSRNSAVLVRCELFRESAE